MLTCSPCGLSLLPGGTTQPSPGSFSQTVATDLNLTDCWTCHPPPHTHTRDPADWTTSPSPTLCPPPLHLRGQAVTRNNVGMALGDLPISRHLLSTGRGPKGGGDKQVVQTPGLQAHYQLGKS